MAEPASLPQCESSRTIVEPVNGKPFPAEDEYVVVHCTRKTPKPHYLHWNGDISWHGGPSYDY